MNFLIPCIFQEYSRSSTIFFLHDCFLEGNDKGHWYVDIPTLTRAHIIAYKKCFFDIYFKQISLKL